MTIFLRAMKPNVASFLANISGRLMRTTIWNGGVQVVSCLYVANGCYAQENPPPSRALATTTQVSALSSIEFWLASAIIAFGFIVLCLQFVLLRRSANTQPDDILRLFTVTIIVIGTLSLIAIGYSSQQIAPALGLFGTILGYLLGRSDEQIRGRRSRALESTLNESSQTQQSE